MPALPALALGAAAWPLAAQTAARLPLRNLLIEVRQGDEASLSESGGGLRSGAVTVGPNGEVLARAGVNVEARSAESARQTTQQVRVLNGGQASVRIGVAGPMQWWQWVLTPQGPAVIAGSQLVETGHGFVVQPRWPGGDAPVTVEVRSEASTLASGGLPSRYSPDGLPLPERSVERSGALTTVQLPLGEWITVASSGEALQRSKRGVLSTRDVARERRVVVQMRVTLP